MSGNLTKSEAGWVRLRENVASRRGVRGAKLDARVGVELPKPKKLKVKGEEKIDLPDEVERKGRKLRRGFVAHNGRY